jgi:transposase
MERHEVSDEQWGILEPLVSKTKAETGRPARDSRQMLNAMIWVLSTGAPWRDLPKEFGPWETVYGYFARWRAGGVFDSILDALHLRLDQEGKIDWDLWCIDGTSIRGSRAAAGATKKVQRAIPMSPKITPWAGRKADLAAKSTSWSMATVRRSK